MNVAIQKSTLEDGERLKHFLLQPDVLEYFPMWDLREVEDGVRTWVMFCKQGASLTAHVDGQACGIAYLNIQAYQKFAHQCILTIIVEKKHRNRGIGTALMKRLMILAREEFGIEFLHLEVYETNPAIHLYKRLGFEVFGEHPKFIKEKGRYLGKILMQRSIVDP